MPKKKTLKTSGAYDRKAAGLQEILDSLQSPDDQTRAQAVRQLCPCESAWGVPIQRYVAPMLDDPSPSVRHEAHHVMDEDSHMGKKLEVRRLKKEVETALESEALNPLPHAIGWQKRRKPLTKRLYYPQRRDIRRSLGR